MKITFLHSYAVHVSFNNENLRQETLTKQCSQEQKIVTQSNNLNFCLLTLIHMCTYGCHFSKVVFENPQNTCMRLNLRLFVYVVNIVNVDISCSYLKLCM